MMNFQQAQLRHKTVETVAQAFPHAGIADGGEDIWNAIAGTNVSQLKTNLAEQVALMMPAPMLPLVRALSHVAAAFAFAAVATTYIEAELAASKTGQPRIGDDEIARKAWEVVEERRQLAHKFQQDFGYGHGPSWEMAIDVQSLDASEVRQVERVAEMAGKMYQVLAAGSTIEVAGVGEVRDVTQGDDLSQVLASEVAQLFEPGLDDHAAVKLMEKAMLQYQQMATVPATRGPLVLLSDESGSMHDDRLVWSKAALAAMARIAHQSDRMVHVVHYGDATAITVLAPNDHRAMLNMIRHYMDGGTSIGKAMKVGIKQVGDLAAQGFAGADLVLVTDGESDDDHEQTQALDEMARQGIDLYTIAIQHQIHPSKPIAARAKHYLEVGNTSMGSGSPEDVVAAMPQDFVKALQDAAKGFKLPPSGGLN